MKFYRVSKCEARITSCVRTGGGAVERKANRHGERRGYRRSEIRGIHIWMKSHRSVLQKYVDFLNRSEKMYISIDANCQFGFNMIHVSMLSILVFRIIDHV